MILTLHKKGILTTMFTHSDIWRAIDQLAKSKGYSPSGLAKKAGLDPTSFNKSKRVSPDGKPRWPSTESISKILIATGLTMADLSGFVQYGGDVPAPVTKTRKEQIAWESAKILLDTEAVLFNAHEPFTFTSGRISPVYTDCRRLISFVQERTTLMNFAAEMLAPLDLDYVAGGETAGIPYAAFVSDRLNKPMLYVRKKPKGFGRMAQIEGYLPEGESHKTILVEDLQTDGGSKKNFIDVLREAGTTVEHAFVVFHYGIYPASEQNMKDLGITLHALTDWWHVLQVAREMEYFDAATLSTVEDFLNDPEGWDAKNRGVS